MLARYLLLTFVCLSACSGQRQGHAFRPDNVPLRPEYLKQLKLPPGFSVTVWATGVGHPRMMAIAGDGTVYVTRTDEGDVIALRDEGGKAGATVTAVELGNVHGIAIEGNRVWLTDVRSIYTGEIGNNGKFGELKKLLGNMRPGGHDRRTISIGPDHKLYVSIGSTCNFCADPPDENAVIWRTNLDGTGREVFARGLRNTIGFGWNPQTKEMWGMDHGVDWLGDDYPREELNKVVQGGDYGWPYCTNDRKPDSRIKPPGGQGGEQYCSKTIPPVLTYTAHSAPIWMLFYNGEMFPTEYKGDALVAFHGSWNREPASGYEVVRVRFENGKPVRFEPFMTGFLMPSGRNQFGRPAGLAVMKDGSLLVSDDDGGVIYRVTYKKP
jgi:glucose/arabinose dehydrogenase